MKTGATSWLCAGTTSFQPLSGKMNDTSAPELELSTASAAICDSDTGELPDRLNCTAVDLVVTSQSISALTNRSPSDGLAFQSPRNGIRGC